MEPGRLELYPYHTFIESSEEPDAAATARVPSGNKMSPDTLDRRRGQRSPGSTESDVVGATP